MIKKEIDNLVFLILTIRTSLKLLNSRYKPMYKFLLSALVFTMASSAYAKPAVQTDRPKRTMKLKATRAGAATEAVKLNCKIAGTPVEFPNDLMVINEGKSAIKKGTTLIWKTKGEKGSHIMKKDLATGESVSLSDVLKNGESAGNKCQVTIKARVKATGKRKLRLKK